MKVAMINTTCDSLRSPSRIMMDIGRYAYAEGHRVLVCYGRGDMSELPFDYYRIGSDASVLCHYLGASLIDGESRFSRQPTKGLIAQLERFKPDVVHLHNLHGHYLNLEILFDYLHRTKVKVIVTMHDCWLLTGHCAFYSHVGCNSRLNSCKGHCPLSREYPRTLISNAHKNCRWKRQLLSEANNFTFVTVSCWLESEVRESLPYADIRTLHNGIDTSIFRPKREVGKENIVLAVANRWDERKNLDHILALKLRNDEKLVIVGRGADRAKGRLQTEVLTGLSPDKLASLYRKAKVTVVASGAESFGMTLYESLACRTPVIVNNACALPERVFGDEEGPRVVCDTSDAGELRSAIDSAVKLAAHHPHDKWRILSSEEMAANYLRLYQELLDSSSLH